MGLSLKQQLNELLAEHQDLDMMIDRLSEDPGVDQLSIQRLKKRKLALKDQIEQVRSLILPDIIA
ncbi:MAG: YdcH family protein [Holosporaceae bacterium]|jgi:hypothetical protein|nr:DUF465 domain-containing protein [Alphaproteobacteria bacterium]MCA3249536.1 YdcH family protein [Rhodospirillaceae bacterium]